MIGSNKRGDNFDKTLGLTLISFEKCLWPSQIKAHGSRSVRSSSPPISSPRSHIFIRFLPFFEMSPLRRQSTIFLQSKLTEELNSEHFWIDGTVVSALCNDAFQLFEGAVAPVEDSPSTTDHPLLSFDDDHLDPPSVSSGDDEYVGFMNFTPDPHPIPFGNQPDDLYATFSLFLSVLRMMTDCTPPHRVALTSLTLPPTPNCSRTTMPLAHQYRRSRSTSSPHRPPATSPSPPSPKSSPLPTCPPYPSTLLQ